VSRQSSAVSLSIQKQTEQNWITKIYQNIIGNSIDRLAGGISWRWAVSQIKLSAEMFIAASLFMSVFFSFGYMIAVHLTLAYTLCRYFQTRSQNTELNSEIDKLQPYRKSAQDMATENQALKGQLALSTVEIGSLESEKNRLTTKNADLEASVQSARTERDQWILARAPLIEEQERLKRECTQLKHSITSLQAEYTKALEQQKAPEIRQYHQSRPNRSSDLSEERWTELFGAIEECLAGTVKHELVDDLYALLEMNMKDRNEICERIRAMLSEAKTNCELELQETLNILDAEAELANRFGILLKGLNGLCQQFIPYETLSQCKREVQIA
jgi:hypothetical protein